jgi:hypothetical protein
MRFVVLYLQIREMIKLMFELFDVKGTEPWSNISNILLVLCKKKIRRVQRPCCAVTTLCNNLHYLRSCVDHNHAPQASDAGVAKLTAQ